MCGVEYRAVILRSAVATMLCLASVLPAIAATDVAANVAVLKHSTDTQQLIDACGKLFAPMFVSARIGSSPGPTADGKAALAGIKDFVLHGHNTRARIRCARYLGNASIQSYDPGTLSKTYSPLAGDANAVLLTLLEDPSPALRIGAANAMWGVGITANGRALLRHADTDPDRDVVAASFQNMFWAMKADVATSHDAEAYDTVIQRGLSSNREDVVVAALMAYAGLHGPSAEPTLRHFALDRRAAVRAGAISAFGDMTRFTKSVIAFIESRLTDSSAEVRDAVMLSLMRFGDVNALPAIDRLAKTASTARERRSAAAYAKAIRKDAANNARLNP